MVGIARSGLLLSSMVFVAVACSSFSATEEQPGGVGADGGSGPSPANEDCLDGRDDNGDGAGDCADPSCAPYVHCVPAVDAPSGWEGYSSIVASGACPPDMPTGDDAWQADDTKPTCAK